MNYKKLGMKKSKDVMVQEDCALEDCEESFTLPRSPKKEHTNIEKNERLLKNVTYILKNVVEQLVESFGSKLI